MPPRSVLEISELSFSFDGRELLRDLSFSIDGGVFAALLGPNGAGKTTLFRLCLGDLTPASGEILLSCSRVEDTPASSLPRLVSFVPQSTAPVFPLTVLDMTLIGLADRTRPFGGPTSEQVERAREAIDLAGLGGMEYRAWSTLSGGEKQLAVLARALVQDAPLMLLDEPTAALDLGHETRVAGILSRLNKERGVTILMSTHSIPLAARLAGRVILLAEGTVLADGTPDEVIRPDLLRRAYGVDARIERDSAGRLTVHAEDGVGA